MTAVLPELPGTAACYFRREAAWAAPGVRPAGAGPRGQACPPGHRRESPAAPGAPDGRQARLPRGPQSGSGERAAAAPQGARGPER